MSRRHTTLPLLTRLTALASSALVLVLTILAASPQWHALVHAAEHSARHAAPAAATCPSGHAHAHSHGESAPALPESHGDELCVITQFSHGSSELALAPALLAAQPLSVLGDPLPLSVFCAPSAPAYLLPPCCGPPLV
jgi:hypothetical protein